MNFVSMFFNRFLRFIVVVVVVIVVKDPKLARVLDDVLAKLATELADADGEAASGARGSNMA